jgi:DNA-directed RNA polymerase specialized sigma24 family protein
VQDAFWAVIRKIESFRGYSAFGSWLDRIVANAAYPEAPAPMDELLADYRAIVVLRDVEGLSHREVSATLRQRLARSSPRLRPG